MEERDIGRYLRREDTVLAKVARKVCPYQGEEYRKSCEKRTIETLIATPAAVIATPVIMGLAGMVKLSEGEDKGPAFYVSERVGKNNEIPIIKIRVMKVGADNEPNDITQRRNQEEDGEVNDPRNTRLGRFLRGFNLEELPQLWQVVLGQLGLVGIRAADRRTIEYMEQHIGVETYNKWLKEYYNGRPSLFSLNSAVNTHPKDNTKRHRLDLFYSEKASLGFDLYILYRTFSRMTKKAIEKISSKLKRVLRSEISFE